jgi:hypothetical protein
MQSIKLGLRQSKRARQTVCDVIATGQAQSERRRLSRLIPIGPDEIDSKGAGTTKLIIAKLSRALRGERARGSAGHWTYDLNRHLGLAQALRAEEARLLQETKLR